MEPENRIGLLLFERWRSVSFAHYMRLTNATAYLTEMRRVNLPEVNLLLLSEPTELRFNHPFFSADRRQIEKVKPLPSVTCRRECTKTHLGNCEMILSFKKLACTGVSVLDLHS